MTELRELRPSHGKPFETNRWPGILFAAVLHGVGVYALMTGSSPSAVALHEKAQLVVFTALPKNDIPPPQPPEFKPPPVVTVLPDIEINLFRTPPPATMPASLAPLAHAPMQTDSTPPVPITSHAVTSDDYPPLSVRLGEQGVVNIRYLVQSDGTIGDCAVVATSGSSRLDDAACTMVKRRWRFRPATEKGKPVAEYLLAEVSFTLVPDN